jgi:alpha-pyrone synthase
MALHPGGRTIVDAIERALDLNPTELSVSRSILRRYGNMSSAAVMFVLDELYRSLPNSHRGCAMAFGPGLVAETMSFSIVRSTL